MNKIELPVFNHCDDSFALHTDKYQINMAQVYWQNGMHNRKAVFEVYFRKLPRPKHS